MEEVIPGEKELKETTTGHYRDLRFIVSRRWSQEPEEKR